MDTTIEGQLELPIRLDRPAKARMRIAKLWSSWKEFRALEKRHGELMPASVVAGILDVSGPRVYELIEAGRLDSFLFHTHRYVSVKSMERFLTTEVKRGRPPKDPGMKAVAKMSVEAGREIVKSIR